MTKIKQYGVILDTNAFGKPNSYNFKNGSVAILLRNISSFSNYHLYIPDIVKQEMLKHITDAVHNDFKKIESRYVKEVLKEDLELDTINSSCQKAKKFFEQCKMSEISCGKYAKLDQINSWYFKGEPPFNVDNKKCEFPDATIISAINEYFLTDNKIDKLFIVSQDNGFKEGIKHNLSEKINYEIIDKVEQLSRQVMGYAGHEISVIKQYLNKNNILNNINEYDINYNSDDDEFDVSVDAVRINNVDIVNIENDRKDVSIIFDINVSGDIFVLDTMTSPYSQYEDGYLSQFYKRADYLEINKLNIFISFYYDEKDEIIDMEIIERPLINLEDYLSKMEYC